MPLTKVTSGAITDSAITTAKIEDGTIVNADISASANIAQSKLSLTLPTISSITIENSQGAIPPSDTSLYFDIIGTNFSNPSTVELLDSSTNVSTNATTVTYVSATQLRVTASLSAGTYKIRVTRSDGFAGISATALLTVSQAVSWSTSAGSLGTFDEGVAISTITLSATSNSAITYAIQSGSLPTGLSLNTSNGEITGTPGSVAADTTSTFTVRATDAESQFADREFNITVTDIVIFQSLIFNDDDSAYLTRTPSSASNRKTWTWSGWVKLGNLSAVRNLFSSSGVNQLRFNSDNSFFVYINDSTVLQTNALYRDTASWYHIIIACDTTQSTASNRTKLYVNGTQITSFATENQLAQNTDTGFNDTTAHTIGRQSGGGFYFDGYMAEVHFIDGQALTPSSFGATDATTGTWKPKTYSGTYGTNGFYLDFNNTSDFGEDQSGNSNNFTASNLASTDQSKDTPHNIFATMNPLFVANISQIPTYTNGNLTLTPNAAAYQTGISSLGVSSGKWYVEMKGNGTPNSANYFGVANETQVNWFFTSNGVIGDASGGYSISNQTGNKYAASTSTSYGSAFSSGDIMMYALDMDNGKVWFGKNGTWFNSGAPASGTGEAFSSLSGTFFFGGSVHNSGYSSVDFNFGSPGFAITSGNADDNGYGNFEYAPPTGFLALCSNNLPEATIKDPSAYFHTQLYTGDGTTGRSITNDANAGNFQPDWLWIKERSSTSNHRLTDSSRGVNKVLLSDGTTEELTRDEIGSYDTDGFTIDGTIDGVGPVNENSQTYVAWQWKANAGSTSSNTDGSITSTVQANTTSGFSIVTYTGTGSAGTVGHGLGKTPHWVVVKDRTSSGAWYNQHIGNTSASYGQALNTTGAEQILSAVFNDTRADSSVFYLGNNINVNTNGNSYVAYIFAPIEGYSKFGKYTGNGSDDGPFVYTGFKPAWIMYKNVSRGTAGAAWWIWDNKRNTFNVVDNYLIASDSRVEGNFDSIDFTSNGFKLRTSDGGQNASGETIIYMAFAEAPFGGILTNEATAR